MCLVIIDENGLLAMWIGRVAEVLGRVRRRQPPVPLRSLPCGWIVGTVVASRPACTPATFLRHARHFVAAARTDVRAWATDPSPAQAGKSRRSRCDTCGLAGSFFFPGKRRGFAIPVADAGVVFFSVEFCHTVRRAGETQIAGTRRFVGSDPFYSVAKLIRVAVSSRYTGNGLSVLRLY